MIEGEGLRGLIAGAHGVRQRESELARGLEMSGEGLERGAPGELERAGEVGVERARVLGIEAAHDGLAHAIVVGLEGLVAARADDADQVLGLERGDEARELGGLGGLGQLGDVAAQRRSGDGGEIEEAARAGLEPADARPERLVEADGAAVVGLREAMPEERLDEERVPARLFDEGVGVDRSGRVALGARALEERADEIAPVARAEAAHREAQQHLAREDRRDPPLREPDPAAQRGDEQERGRVGEAEHLEEQGEAVSVGPLEVVDREHQRRARSEPPQELAQGGEDAGATPDRIERERGRRGSRGGAVHGHAGQPFVRGRPREHREATDARQAEHREDLLELIDVRREQRLDVGGGERERWTPSASMS